MGLTEKGEIKEREDKNTSAAKEVPVVLYEYETQEDHPEATPLKAKDGINDLTDSEGKKVTKITSYRLAVEGETGVDILVHNGKHHIGHIEIKQKTQQNIPAFMELVVWWIES